METEQSHPKPSLLMALLPVVLTIMLLAVQLFVFEDFTPHIPLTIGIAITAIFGWLRGYSWIEMEKGIWHLVSIGMPAMAILLAVGMLIGVWIISGVVPVMVYYGLSFLSADTFLLFTCLICSVISLAVGTSWGTTGTVGLALMGIGAGLGIPAYMTAGAVVSGAFFGDKMSPLSDSTNLAAAVAEVNLWTHIRNMIPTTGPAMLLALMAYTVLGFNITENQVSTESITPILEALEANFNLNPVMLLPAVVVVFLAVRKFPPLPSIFTGIFLGGLLAIFGQDRSLHEVFNAMQNGYVSNTGIETIDKLLSKGGLVSMAWVILLAIIALGFGGILERTQCLKTILEAVMKKCHNRFGVVFATMASSLGINIAAGETYLAIMLPARMYSPAFRSQGLSAANAARCAEDGGTLMAPLIPWNVGGVFVATTLGVETLAYAPYAIGAWLAPVFGLIWAYTGYFMLRPEQE
ncbi:MAG: Na+/H+ antiporter NhaC [Amphritea sp.]